MSCQCQLPIVFLVLFGTLSQMHKVEGKTCQVGMGACGATKLDCDGKCFRRFPNQNPRPSCDTSTSPPLCTCFYNCAAEEKANVSVTATSTAAVAASPVPLEKKVKYCTGAGLGICSRECNEGCCGARCAQKYTGGDGICVTIGNTALCQCQYPC